MSPTILASALRSGTDPTTSIPSTPRSLSAPTARLSIRGPPGPFDACTALVIKGLKPASSRISPTCSTMSVSSGLRRSALRTPTVFVRTADSERAATLIRYPSSSAACCTRRRWPAATQRSPRSTNDTSDFDTPARSATSRMVGRRSVPPASLILPPTVGRPQLTGQAGVHHADRDPAVLSYTCRGHPNVDPPCSRTRLPIYHVGHVQAGKSAPHRLT